MTDSPVLAPADPNDFVIFVQPSTAPRGFTPHSRIGDELRSRVADLNANYHEILAQILAMLTGSDQATEHAGLKLSEVTVGLGFDAKGKLGFIAEAGVNATVTVKFARSSQR